MCDWIAEDTEADCWLGIPRRFAPIFEIGERITVVRFFFMSLRVLFPVIPSGVEESPCTF